MTDSIIKNFVPERVMQAVVIPGSPGVPAVAGHYETRTETICGLEYSTSGKYVAVTEQTPLGPVTKSVWVPDGGGGASSTWVCREVTSSVWVPTKPAIPAVPSRTVMQEVTVQRANLGWNAGGRSIAAVVGDFVAEFKVREDAVGVLAGMNAPDGADGYPGNNIDLAFYCQAGNARVYRNGSYAAAGGAYTDATVFRIERTGNTVTWKMDGSTVHTATVALTNALRLEASLYSAGDEVFDPALTQGTGPVDPDDPEAVILVASMLLELDLDIVLEVDAGLRTDLDLDFQLVPQVETFTTLRLDLDLSFDLRASIVPGSGYADPDDDLDWGAGQGDGAGGDAWAVNLDGFGSTAYAGFPFRSLANIGGRYFGASAAGIRELAGDTDAGAEIRAVVDFGERALAKGNKMTVAQAYLGMSSTGPLLLRIVAEGRAFTYRTRSYSEHMQQQRITLGKGLRPNYATLQLSNEDGARFEVDSLEFMPLALTRRI